MLIFRTEIPFQKWRPGSFRGFEVVQRIRQKAIAPKTGRCFPTGVTHFHKGSLQEKARLEFGV